MKTLVPKEALPNPQGHCGGTGGAGRGPMASVARSRVFLGAVRAKWEGAKGEFSELSIFVDVFL